jgi:hypothetical protein
MRQNENGFLHNTRVLQTGRGRAATALALVMNLALFAISPAEMEQVSAKGLIGRC